MAVTIISRAGWGAKPPESRTPWPNGVSALEGICQHWFGSPKASATHTGCDDLLRGVQRSHQAGEFSDIAYNFGVCPHGSVYELRGWNTQTGANGTNVANKTLLAIVYMAGVGDPLTPAGRQALIDLYEEAFKKGVGQKAVGHGTITGSECPGPAVRNFLASGAWRPRPEPDKVRLQLMNGEGNPIGDPSTPYVPGPDEWVVITNWLKRRASGLPAIRKDGDISIRRRKV